MNIHEYQAKALLAKFAVPLLKGGVVQPLGTSVGGTLHLSVCSAANCIVDKVPLEITVEVK